MAARARALWEPCTGAQEQGCPTCCSRGRGWCWERDVGTEARGAWEWDEERDSKRGAWVRSESGGAKKDATLQHVLCGECEGIPEDTRAVVKEGMATHLRMALRAMTRRDRRGAAVVARREAAVAQIGAAQRALAKGEARSTALEREAMARR